MCQTKTEIVGKFDSYLLAYFDVKLIILIQRKVVNSKSIEDMKEILSPIPCIALFDTFDIQSMHHINIHHRTLLLICFSKY